MARTGLISAHQRCDQQRSAFTPFDSLSARRFKETNRICQGVTRAQHRIVGEHRTGFTLIEMMIVIVVIAILIGVLLPNFRGTQDEANTQRARAEMRTLATALESYYIHNSNAYPSALSSLTSVTPLIVSRIPSDPFNGSTAYQYATGSGYYVVWSIGPNRTVGLTGINSSGALTGTQGDDICVTNGTATTC